MSTSSIVTLTVLGIFTLFILNKKQKRLSDFLLVLINLTLAINVYFDFSALQEAINGYKLFFHFNASFWFISSFLLYAYSLIEGKGKLVLKWWFFAFSIPFFLFSAYDLLLDSTKTIETYQTILVDPNLGYHFFFKFHKQ